MRERQVLALVAEGCTNIEIGKRLFIARTTVRTHLENIFIKLCVHDRTEAVVKYFFSDMTARTPARSPRPGFYDERRTDVCECPR